MKKKLILIALLLCSCNKYASSENMYYTMSVSPYDGYCLVFNDDFTLMKYGHNVLNSGCIKINVKNNEVFIYENTSSSIGKFIDKGIFEMKTDYIAYKSGIYKLTDIKYEGGWNND